MKEERFIEKFVGQIREDVIQDTYYDPDGTKKHIVSGVDRTPLEKARKDDEFAPSDLGGFGFPGGFGSIKRPDKKGGTPEGPKVSPLIESEMQMSSDESERLIEGIEKYLSENCSP